MCRWLMIRQRSSWPRPARATHSRLLGYAVVSTVGVFALGACNVIHPTSGSGVQSPSLATLKAVPPATTPSLAVTRGCLATDFEVGAGATGAYQGEAVYSMVLRNVSGVACSLSGAPAMTLSLQAGAPVPVSLGDAASEGVDVGPGQILHIMIGVPGPCSNPTASQPASSITVSLPEGSLVDKGVSLNLECGPPNVLIFTPVDPPSSTPEGIPTPTASVGSCTWSQSDGCTYLSSPDGGTGSVTVIGGQWFGNVPPATAYSCTPGSSTTPNEETCTFTEPASSSGAVTIVASRGSAGTATGT
jgi:hypothetical protein